MTEEAIVEEQSHYEISLTAAQAFVAFVLLLLSLAASFAFGVMVGKGSTDERLVVRQTPAVVTEASSIPKGARIEELGLDEATLRSTPATTSATDNAAVAAEGGEAVVVEEQQMPAGAVSEAVAEGATADEVKPSTPRNEPASTPRAEAEPKPAETKPAEKPAAIAGTGPVFAQLMSTTEASTAENLAARLIEGGFKSAYVERMRNERGLVYRVRVKFATEAEARSAIDRLKPYSKSEIWITRQ